MANRTLLLCLVLCVSLTCYFESVVGAPKGGYSRGGGSRGGGSSSWGRGGSSSSSSGSSWSSWNSKPSYPSSGGLSGYGSGSSKPSYPSSSSGLSGSNSLSSWNSKPSYPSSGGLSGYGTGGSSNHGYPSSNSGLSGSGKKPSYPSSSTGLSGSGTSSSSGSNSGSSWSWWGSSSSSNNNHGTSSSSNNNHGTHSYPNSNGGLSGGSRPSYGGSSRPAGVDYTNSHYGNHGNSHTNGKYGNNYATPHHTGTHVVNNHYNSAPHPYYSSPQYVYVTEYRNSGSRYGDILTGLALYNMGRSHSHYHTDHYYQDDYYRHRYNDGSMNGNNSPQNGAVCTMKITENGRIETLKIPCEIVSTFAKEGKQVEIPQSQVNTTTCVTNSTMLNNTAPLNTTSVNATVSSNVTMINSTTCTFTVNATDPLKVKGPALNPSNMDCEVEIRTREHRITNKVDCSTLLRYSKMPEPAKSQSWILPERQKLKQLIHNPPWWMSLFIAV